MLRDEYDDRPRPPPLPDLLLARPPARGQAAALGGGLRVPRHRPGAAVPRRLPARGPRLRAQRRRAAARAAAAGRASSSSGPAAPPSTGSAPAGSCSASLSLLVAGDVAARVRHDAAGGRRSALALSGVAFGVSWPASQSLIAAVVPPELRQRYFGVNFTLLNLGIGIGGISAALLRRRRPARHLPGDLPRRRRELPAGAAPALGAAAPRRRPAAAHDPDERPRPIGYLAVLRRPAVAPLMLLGFVSSFVGYSQLNAGMPAYARAVGEISTRAWASPSPPTRW